MAANTVIVGANGSVDLGAGRGARIASFSADLVHEIYDCTGYSSGGFRQNKGGLKSCSGSCVGWLTKGSTKDQPGFTALTAGDDGQTIYLSADTGCTYSFAANIANIRVDHSVADNARVSFSFVSNGTITENWTTS